MSVETASPFLFPESELVTEPEEQEKGKEAEEEEEDTDIAQRSEDCPSLAESKLKIISDTLLI